MHNKRAIKCEIYHDNFQNYKSYGIRPAQLVVADIPYNLGKNAYGSNPEWYVGGDNKNGESKKASSEFFRGDGNFNLAEFMHFCNKLVKKEPKGRNQAGAMIVFCAFEQMPIIQEYGKRYDFPNSYPLVFIKNSSSQVLKANMKIVGACEYALVLYRNKLPKFRNGVQQDEAGKNIRGTGKMIKNWFKWELDDKNIYPKIHPTQKPVTVLKQLIEIFTDEGDTVIDPVCGSGSTLRAAKELGRNSYGFESNKDFYNVAKNIFLEQIVSKQEGSR